MQGQPPSRPSGDRRKPGLLGGFAGLDPRRRAILLGGDTDTIAAMAGALSGAYLGVDAIPAELLRRLEDDVKGRTYLAYLAEQLHQSHETRAMV